MSVVRARMLASALWCCGSRCCTRTNPNPVLAGSCLRSWENASRPPDEAPIPTTGHGLLLWAETRDGLALVGFLGCFLEFFFIVTRVSRIAHSAPCPESPTPSQLCDSEKGRHQGL